MCTEHTIGITVHNLGMYWSVTVWVVWVRTESETKSGCSLHSPGRRGVHWNMCQLSSHFTGDSYIFSLSTHFGWKFTKVFLEFQETVEYRKNVEMKIKFAPYAINGLGWLWIDWQGKFELNSNFRHNLIAVQLVFTEPQIVIWMLAFYSHHPPVHLRPRHHFHIWAVHSWHTDIFNCQHWCISYIWYNILWILNMHFPLFNLIGISLLL